MGLAAQWQSESSQTRDQTRVPCIGRWILNHWTTREVRIWQIAGQHTLFQKTEEADAGSYILMHSFAQHQWKADLDVIESSGLSQSLYKNNRINHKQTCALIPWKHISKGRDQVRKWYVSRDGLRLWRGKEMRFGILLENEKFLWERKRGDGVEGAPIVATWRGVCGASILRVAVHGVHGRSSPWTPSHLSTSFFI